MTRRLADAAVWFVIALAVAAFLFLVEVAGATTGDGWRWARYDAKPVRVHIVTDQSVDGWLTNLVKTAAHGWEQGDIQFDFPPPVKDCSQAAKQNTICVSVDEGQNCGTAAYGCFQPGPPIGVAPDGRQLFSYARAWINQDHGPDSDLRVLCHELGHGIGVGHTEDGPPTGVSCMSNSEFSTVPSQADLDYVHTMYQVTDPKPGPTAKAKGDKPPRGPRP